MPSLNLRTKTINYTAADLRALEVAATLLAAMQEYDAKAKLDATTAAVAITHLVEHVKQQRS